MITQQWTVWCDRCSAMDQISGFKHSVRKEFKANGWTRKKKEDLCPKCSLSVAQKKEADILFGKE